MLFYFKFKSNIIALFIAILILPGCAELIILDLGLRAIGALNDPKKSKKVKSVQNIKTTKNNNKIIKNPCRTNPKSCTKIQLCYMAKDGSNWYVKEAKKRGYNCGVKITPKSCPQNIEVCTNNIICIGATAKKNAYYSKSDPFSKYRTEAKRRNLKCNY